MLTKRNLLTSQALVYAMPRKPWLTTGWLRHPLENKHSMHPLEVVTCALPPLEYCLSICPLKFISCSHITLTLNSQRANHRIARQQAHNFSNFRHETKVHFDPVSASNALLFATTSDRLRVNATQDIEALSRPPKDLFEWPTTINSVHHQVHHQVILKHLLRHSTTMLAHTIRVSGNSKDNGDSRRKARAMIKAMGIRNRVINKATMPRRRGGCNINRVAPRKATLSNRGEGQAQAKGAALRCWVR